MQDGRRLGFFNLVYHLLVLNQSDSPSTPPGGWGGDKCLETFPSVTEWEGDSGAPGV